MKAIPKINPAGSSPIMNDNLLVYEDSIYNSNGEYGDGNGIWYSIDTEIRSKLNVQVFAIGDTEYSTIELPITIENASDGTKTVNIQIPSISTCAYRISGISAIETPVVLPYGVSKRSEESMNFWRCHRHDGTLSSKVWLGHIWISPLAGDRLIQTNHDSNQLIYGEKVVVVGPVFTLPALVSPKDGIIFDFTDPTMVAFSWNAATNMTNFDHYTIYFYEFYNGEPGPLVYSEEVAGNIEEVTISSTNLVAQGSNSIMWFVIAHNENGKMMTEKRSYTYIPWQL